MAKGNYRSRRDRRALEIRNNSTVAGVYATPRGLNRIAEGEVRFVLVVIEQFTGPGPWMANERQLLSAIPAVLDPGHFKMSLDSGGDAECLAATIAEAGTVELIFDTNNPDFGLVVYDGRENQFLTSLGFELPAFVQTIAQFE